jgi:NAD(P)-dependent dehydrogenase (short-subunit alcohol dehydrogenase family)
MSKNFERSVVNGAVLVTGASTGIGKTCALHFGWLGFQVFAGVRKPEDGDALKKEANGNIIPVILDVTNAASIAAAYNQISEIVGEKGLVGLINNAGVAVFGPIEFLELDELRRQMEINVIGLVAVTQKFLPLIRQARGRIVNIGSISGKNALPLLAPYAASKFAVEAITDALRMELMPWNIKVSVIEPGAVKTPIWQKAQQESSAYLEKLPPEGHARYGKLITAMQKITRGMDKNAMPASEVVEAVDHALTAKNPKTRYPVGREAKATLFFLKVPDKWRDKLVARTLDRMAQPRPK